MNLKLNFIEPEQMVIDIPTTIPIHCHIIYN